LVWGTHCCFTATLPERLFGLIGGQPQIPGVAGGAVLRGSPDPSPSSGPSSNRSTASTALDSAHSGPLHAPAAPVRIATTGIPFGQGRGAAARGPNPPASRVISPQHPSPGMLTDWAHSDRGVIRTHHHTFGFASITWLPLNVGRTPRAQHFTRSRVSALRGICVLWRAGIHYQNAGI
jgi:hypothetical protein